MITWNMYQVSWKLEILRVGSATTVPKKSGLHCPVQVQYQYWFRSTDNKLVNLVNP